MMRPVSLAYPPLAPQAAFADGAITWTDRSISETGYAVQKLVGGAWTEVWRSDRVLALPNATGEVFTFGEPWTSGDRYRVVAENTVGDTWNYADANLNEILLGGFPTVTARAFSAEVEIP